MNFGKAMISIRGAEANVVLQSLMPEVKRSVSRGSVKVEGFHGSAILSVETPDIASLRATLNSYLRWAEIAVKVTHEVGK